MGKFKKVVLIIFGLLLVIQTVLYMALLYSWIPIITWFQSVTAIGIIRYLIVGTLTITMFSGLAVLISVLVSRSDGESFFPHPRNDTRVSKAALNRLVRRSLSQHFELVDVHVVPKVFSWRRAVALDIEAMTVDPDSLNGRGKQIRQRIITDVQNYLGVPVTDVTLHFRQIKEEPEIFV